MTASAGGSPSQEEAGAPSAALVRSWIEQSSERREQERRESQRRSKLMRRMPGAQQGTPARIAVDGGTGIRVSSRDVDAFADPIAGLPTRAKVLWLQPDHLGDVLLRGPALAALRSRLPDARVTLAVGPWSGAVARGLPGVDRHQTIPFPAFERRPAAGRRRGADRLTPYMRLIQAALRLRAEGFDAAIIGRDDDTWSAWLAALAGVPRRIGHDHPTLRPFLTHAVAEEDRPAHVAAASLTLVGATEPASAERHPLHFAVSAADHAGAEALLAPLGVDVQGRPVRPIAVHPGSGSALKRWRSDRWATALAARTSSTPIVITGGPSETALARELAQAIQHGGVSAEARPPVLNLAGRTSPSVLAAVFARCSQVLGPDSGPLHLAVAVGTPTVHLYGPADAVRFGPWGTRERHRVVASKLACAPCGIFDWAQEEQHSCMRGIDPMRVGRAIHGADGTSAEG